MAFDDFFYKWFREDISKPVTIDLTRSGGILRPELPAFRHPEYNLSLSNTQRKALLDKFSVVSNTRESMINSLESLRNTSLVQTVLDVIIDDAFSISNSNELFSVTYEDTDKTGIEISNIIEAFFSKFKIYDIINDTIEDFLLYGEYALNLTVGDAGIVDIDDNVSLKNFLGIYKSGDVSFFLQRTNKNVYVKKNYEFAHFVLSPRKIRIDSSQFKGCEQINDYIRVGRSIIYPAIDKIKEIQILDTAAMAQEIRKLMTPLLIQVGVPSNTPPDEVSKIVRQYESYLAEVYSRADFSDSSQLNIESILDIVTSVKVLPSFADSKGNLQIFQNDQDLSSSNELIANKRKIAALAMGIPPAYLSAEPGDVSQAKTELLKLYSRYSRKLTSIQTSLSNGIKNMILIHLTNKKIVVDPNKIIIKFKSVVSVDTLDDMEFMAAVTQTLQDFYTFASTIGVSPDIPVKVDPDKLVKFINAYLKPLPNVDGLFYSSKSGTTPPEEAPADTEEL